MAIKEFEPEKSVKRENVEDLKVSKSSVKPPRATEKLYSHPTHQPRCGIASLATFKRARTEVSVFYFSMLSENKNGDWNAVGRQGMSAAGYLEWTVCRGWVGRDEGWMN